VPGATSEHQLCLAASNAGVGGNHRERGAPLAIRCDNGPELTSRHFLAWAIERGIELVHIQPGRPMQNGRLESFNGKLREECLRVSWFQNLFDARRKIAAWQKEGVQRRASAQQLGLSHAEGVRGTRHELLERWSGARGLKRRPLAHLPAQSEGGVNINFCTQDCVK